MPNTHFHTTVQGQRLWMSREVGGPMVKGELSEDNVDVQHGVSPRHEVVIKYTLVSSENASTMCNPATVGMASSTTITLPITTPSTTLTRTTLISCH